MQLKANKILTTTGYEHRSVLGIKFEPNERNGNNGMLCNTLKIERAIIDPIFHKDSDSN